MPRGGQARAGGAGRPAGTKRRTVSRYTPEQRSTAIAAIAVSGGHLGDTAEKLGIPYETLTAWRRAAIEQGLAARERLRPGSGDNPLTVETFDVAAAWLETELLALAGVNEVIARAMAAAREGTGPAPALRDLITAAGIAADKRQDALYGRGTRNGQGPVPVDARSVHLHLQGSMSPADQQRLLREVANRIDGPAPNVQDARALSPQTE